jgi:RNA polymerase subunit RPABC4/transcription elongation factor Spt4
MRCKICNAYIPEGLDRCLECGAGPEPEQVCQKCGTLVSASARFCRKCGSPLLPPPDIAVQPRSAPSPVKSSADAPPCPKCGSYVPVGLKYCPTCGALQSSGQPLPDTYTPMKIASDQDWTDKTGDSACPKCGAEPRGSGRFCYSCGRFLKSETYEIICPECGSRDTLRYSRCQFCGADLPLPVKTKK